MSRSLNGSSRYLARTASVPVSTYPYSVAGWFYGAVPGDNRSLFCFGLSSAAQSHYLLLRGGESGTLRIAIGGSIDSSPTGNLMTASAWQHFAMVETSATSRIIVLNGVWASRGTSTNNNAWGGYDQFAFGVYYHSNGAQDYFFNGLIAQYAVWNSALSQAQIEALAGSFSAGVQNGSGANPQAVQAANLVAYWPIVGTASPEPDDKNDYDMTLTGTPPQGASDPVVDAYSAGSSTLPRSLTITRQAVKRAYSY